MGFDFTQFLSNAEDAFRRQEEAALDATNEFAEVIMADSKELCPVSPTDPKHPNYTGTSGALRDSGIAEPAEIVGGHIEARLTYNTNYAAAVHEVPEANHQYPGAVNPKAEYKYLEKAMRQRAPKFAPYVAQKMKEAIGG